MWKTDLGRPVKILLITYYLYTLQKRLENKNKTEKLFRKAVIHKQVNQVHRILRI